MPIFQSNRLRAAVLILLLGVGLLVALLPFATGLVGGLALYVILAPVHAKTRRMVGPRASAGIVTLLALLLLVVPALAFAGILAGRAPAIASGILNSELLGRLAQVRLGSLDVGQQLARISEQVVSFLGSSAIGLIGTATRVGLNLTIALFVLYYLLIRSEETWAAVRPYIPFSEENTELLRARFRDVTVSTIVGTVLIAGMQGALVALGFWFTGLPNALFWGVVTVVFAVLPVVGSGLVWAPAAVSLALSDRYGAAIGLAIGGILLVGNVDLVIRPLVFRRYAQIHPLVTLLGAMAGIQFFGLLGILIGPLALSYFFELIPIYRNEFLSGDRRDTPTLLTFPSTPQGRSGMSGTAERRSEGT